jgi:hypothetical protein
MNAPVQTRIPLLIKGAILLSFFALGILFPLHYPVREVVTLGVWILAFPSRVGYLSFFLAPFFANATYGYYAFNLFCVLATLGTATGFMRWAELNGPAFVQLHRLTRACLIFNLILAVWQAIDGEAWMRVFPEMYAMGNGRGGGLQTEPSLLAPPLVLYLSFCLWHYLQGTDDAFDRGKMLFEAATLSVATILVTESLSVVIVVVCFLPAFLRSLRRLIPWAIGGAIATAIVLGDRIRDALSGPIVFTELITSAVGSWRNVPDIVILYNWQAFLLPQHPGEIRDKLNAFAALWNLDYAWLDNTYSTFSASASTLGLVVTLFLFGFGVWIGYRKVSRVKPIWRSWILLYVVDWFILPKFVPCGWVGIGLLTALAFSCEVEESATSLAGTDYRAGLAESAN